jgi:hypothetical protein
MAEGMQGRDVDSCWLTSCILIMCPFSLFVFGVYSSCSLRDGVVANVLFLMWGPKRSHETSLWNLLKFSNREEN